MPTGQEEKTLESNEITALEAAIAGIISVSNHVVIFQVGANDGVTVDPVRRILERHNKRVSGVLIEPQYEAMTQLKINYSGFPNIYFENCAVSDTTEIKLYRIKDKYQKLYKGIIASGITSSNYEFVLRKTKLVDAKVEPTEIVEAVVYSAQTLDSIMAKYIQLSGDAFIIQVDAEGYDDAVIFTLTLEEHKPALINYEFSNLTTERHEALRSHLREHSYSIFRWSESDELAVLND